MKNFLHYFFPILLIAPLFNVGCQNSNGASGAKNTDIFVGEHVLETAKWAGFDYMGVLNRAKTGETIAIKQFLEFHGTTDDMDAINHAVTCLELIPVVSDDLFAQVVSLCKPRLREVLRERLVLAAGRTKNPALANKTPEISCPLTWKALVTGVGPSMLGTGDSTQPRGGETPAKGEKPASPKEDADVPAAKQQDGGKQ